MNEGDLLFNAIRDLRTRYDKEDGLDHTEIEELWHLVGVAMAERKVYRDEAQRLHGINLRAMAADLSERIFG